VLQSELGNGLASLLFVARVHSYCGARGDVGLALLALALGLVAGFLLLDLGVLLLGLIGKLFNAWVGHFDGCGDWSKSWCCNAISWGWSAKAEFSGGRSSFSEAAANDDYHGGLHMHAHRVGSLDITRVSFGSSKCDLWFHESVDLALLLHVDACESRVNHPSELHRASHWTNSPEFQVLNF
jgi:hypothetical protein